MIAKNPGVIPTGNPGRRQSPLHRDCEEKQTLKQPKAPKKEPPFTQRLFRRKNGKQYKLQSAAT
jgi:hypothetical protein